jgi:hypothetical protein
LQPGESSSGGPISFWLEFRIPDQRTELVPDGEDSLRIEARVTCANADDFDARSMTSGIAFQAEGTNASWLQLDGAQGEDGWKSVAVKARPPEQGDELEDHAASILVTVTIKSREASERVYLKLLWYTVRFISV